MPCNISRIEYFRTTIKDRPGEAYKFLSQLALLKINLLAFSATPVSPTDTPTYIFSGKSQIHEKRGFTGRYVSGRPQSCPACPMR